MKKKQEIKKTRMTLSNCIFIFDTKEDLEEVWQAIVARGYTDIISNTFVVMKENWQTKVIKWLFKKGIRL